MKIKASILFCLLICSTFKNVNGQEISELNPARSFLMEADSMCALDNGNLWGINLYGPTMLVIPENRLIIANQQDNDKSFVEKNNLFVGKLPENINLANTSLDWGGENWTMIRWEALSPTDKFSRNKLIIHERWHRIQDKIGIPAVMTSNTHLDEAQGAILLKLEFIALKNALIADQPTDKILHLTNALTIRKYRQILFPGNNENVFERHEGLAEFTGYKLCGIDKSLFPTVIAQQLELSMDKDGLANSFPYITGPAYGFLFDELKSTWIENTKSGKSLPEIGSEIIENEIPTDTLTLKTEISKIINDYNAESFVINETEKFNHEKSLIDGYKQKFAEGDQLIIRNNNLSFSFNPQEKLIPFDDIGVIYKTMRITGEWGILEVKNGVMRSNDWQLFIVSAPRTSLSGHISEPDYDLILNGGWKVVKIKEGKYTLKK